MTEAVMRRERELAWPASIHHAFVQFTFDRALGGRRRRSTLLAANGEGQGGGAVGTL
jgi:hypothetical protein